MDFIYEKHDNLNKMFCKNIISTFENTKKYENREISSLRLETDKNRWKTYDTILFQELNKCLTEYIKKVKDITDIFNSEIRDNGFMIEKFNKNKGHVELHNDTHILSKDSVRILTYIWFLNTVYVGGEIEINNQKIKAEVGKLIIFPSTWTYTYKQNIPISEDKYTIIGGFYKKI